MAVPKRRTSKSRRDKRRTHKVLTPPTISTCKKCGEPKLPHHICEKCGIYNEKQILTVKE